ncbi:MAG TPA: Zn-ribbon domain-containing OB-fold protein [Mycobacteriales bacterium]|nr:Zn-ribbon domain-containing OB-fold protein [Mycobacteriales bacterium]
MTAAPARVDLPVIDAATAPFWEGTQRSALLIRHCDACGRKHFYPRPFCPYCWSDQVHWEQANGTGTLYTYSIVYANDLPPFRDRLPYVAAIVALDEGPKMMSNLVECELSDVQVGMPLEVVFNRQTDEVTLPVWRPRR